MCVYAYMYVLYVIPQYHVFFIVYINPITTFILYIITFYNMFYAFDAIMFYCTLSEMTRIKMINQSMFTQPFVQVQIKDISKLRVTGLCEGNSPVTGEFPAQMASNAENVSIWWRHHVLPINHVKYYT